MKRRYFEVVMQRTDALDNAFEPIQEAVEAAHSKGEPGAVFCQLSVNTKGNYCLRGEFYTREQALLIKNAQQAVMRL